MLAVVVAKGVTSTACACASAPRSALCFLSVPLAMWVPADCSYPCAIGLPVAVDELLLHMLWVAGGGGMQICRWQALALQFAGCGYVQ
jgi:hypothetical protein